jgi:hypothetical protein
MAVSLAKDMTLSPARQESDSQTLWVQQKGGEVSAMWKVLERSYIKVCIKVVGQNAQRRQVDKDLTSCPQGLTLVTRSSGLCSLTHTIFLFFFNYSLNKFLWYGSMHSWMHLFSLFSYTQASAGIWVSILILHGRYLSLTSLGLWLDWPWTQNVRGLSKTTANRRAPKVPCDCGIETVYPQP